MAAGAEVDRGRDRCGLGWPRDVHVDRPRSGWPDVPRETLSWTSAAHRAEVAAPLRARVKAVAERRSSCAGRTRCSGRGSPEPDRWHRFRRPRRTAAGQVRRGRSSPTVAPNPTSRPFHVKHRPARRAPGTGQHPGLRRGQPEGRRRQDHQLGQPRRRPRARRPLGAGDRPRSAGQRVHRARRRPPAGHAGNLRGADRRRSASPSMWSTPPRRPDLKVLPATIDLAGAEIELVRSSPGRTACSERSRRTWTTIRSTTCSWTAPRRSAC